MNIEDKKKQYLTRDRLINVIDKAGRFRAAAIKNTNAVAEAQRRHELPSVPAAMLARAMSAATLMASFLKGEERLILDISGDGAITRLFAESMQAGEIRAFANYDKIAVEREFEKISDILGEGTLTVTKILYDQAEPLTSISRLIKGDITSDIIHFFTKSEQIATTIILDVDLNEEGLIRQSGGIIIQTLPGTNMMDVRNTFEEFHKDKSYITLLDEEIPLDQTLKKKLPFEFDIVKSIPVDFMCRCSKENFLSKLQTLNLKDLQEMKDEDNRELVCMYCNKKYYLNDEDFDHLIEQAKAKVN
jgi:molecular chaperone Hsp33